MLEGWAETLDVLADARLTADIQEALHGLEAQPAADLTRTEALRLATGSEHGD